MSFTVRYAFINVCSLMTMSVVSAFGLLTRDAIAVESVSTMTLRTCQRRVVRVCVIITEKRAVSYDQVYESNNLHDA